jgi:hypothetical protein
MAFCGGEKGGEGEEYLKKISVSIHGDQKVSVHLITIQKVTSNVHSVPRHSADMY